MTSTESVGMTDEQIEKAHQAVRALAEEHELEVNGYKIAYSDGPAAGTNGYTASLWDRRDGTHPWYRRVLNYDGTTGRWSTNHGIELATAELRPYVVEHLRQPRHAQDVLVTVQRQLAAGEGR